jgi:mRNA interferase MazF
MARILRGEIRWASLDPTLGREQAGHRPVVILSHDVFNERSETVIALAITSKEPRVGFPLAMEIRARGLTKRSWVKISQVRTISIERLGKKLARVAEEDLANIIEGLNEIIAH